MITIIDIYFSGIAGNTRPSVGFYAKLLLNPSLVAAAVFDKITAFAEMGDQKPDAR
jgi:hypothetical protein